MKIRAVGNLLRTLEARSPKCAHALIAITTVRHTSYLLSRYPDSHEQAPRKRASGESRYSPVVLRYLAFSLIRPLDQFSVFAGTFGI